MKLGKKLKQKMRGFNKDVNQCLRCMKEHIQSEIAKISRNCATKQDVRDLRDRVDKIARHFDETQRAYERAFHAEIGKLDERIDDNPYVDRDDFNALQKQIDILRSKIAIPEDTGSADVNRKWEASTDDRHRPQHTDYFCSDPNPEKEITRGQVWVSKRIVNCPVTMQRGWKVVEIVDVVTDILVDVDVDYDAHVKTFGSGVIHIQLDPVKMPCGMLSEKKFRELYEWKSDSFDQRNVLTPVKIIKKGQVWISKKLVDHDDISWRGRKIIEILGFSENDTHHVSFKEIEPTHGLNGALCESEFRKRYEYKNAEWVLDYELERGHDINNIKEGQHRRGEICGPIAIVRTVKPDLDEVAYVHRDQRFSGGVHKISSLADFVAQYPFIVTHKKPLGVTIMTADETTPLIIGETWYDPVNPGCKIVIQDVFCEGTLAYGAESMVVFDHMGVLHRREMSVENFKRAFYRIAT